MSLPTNDKRERDRRYERNGRNPKAAWYKLPEWAHPVSGRRALQLKAEPFCRFHAKRGERVPATTADHIERHGYDPVKFWRGELQSLCKHCHDGIKQSMERGNRAGCDESGMPIDPRHPWSS